jgi:2,3-diaminopropionate biosynthesis protein SbnB
VEITHLIESAYRRHGEHETINPDSYFLRFPDRPTARIIALPASIRGDGEVHGIKWISSFPENVAAGRARASAVLILNHPDTGFPLACLEASIISATRTAASAALATLRLSRARGVRPRRVGYVGAGVIARYIHRYLVGNGFEFDEIGVHDLAGPRADGFVAELSADPAAEVRRHDRVEDLIAAADLIVFATVAGRPYLHDPTLLAHNPLVLNVSLRDLAPEIILAGYNVVDDIDHCLKADTGPHLAEKLTHNRDFIAGTLFDVVRGTIPVPADQPVIFSPFGLGVLDLVVGKFIYDRLCATGELRAVPGFFADPGADGPPVTPARAEVVRCD